MFKRQSSDTHFLFITLVLVLLLGIPIFHTLTAEDEMPEVAVASLGTAGVEAGGRGPASIPTMVPVRAGKATLGMTSLATSYDLSCSKKGLQKINVNGSYVQLQGKNCLKNLSSGDIEIVNKSNGYTASIFNSGSNQYQTDLIQLRGGDNEIVIRYRERSGKPVEETIHVHAPKI